jgi:hypothetical protein
MHIIEVIQHVIGLDYRQLIAEVASISDRFGVVIRGDVDADQFIAQMGERPIVNALQDRWPGTELQGATARVLQFPCSGRVIRGIQESADDLFGWLQPDRPEDLFAISEARQVVTLETVAHEGWGTLRVPEILPFWKELIARGVLKQA